jgi:hypothetical protein
LKRFAIFFFAFFFFSSNLAPSPSFPTMLADAKHRSVSPCLMRRLLRFVSCSLGDLVLFCLFPAFDCNAQDQLDWSSFVCDGRSQRQPNLRALVCDAKGEVRFCLVWLHLTICSAYMAQFILHAALDLVDEMQWKSNWTFLKTVDKYNDLWISGYVTPGGVRLLLLHESKVCEKRRVSCVVTNASRTRMR